MAVDRRAMLKNVFGAYGMPLYGPFPHALPVADTTLPGGFSHLLSAGGSVVASVAFRNR